MTTMAAKIPNGVGGNGQTAPIPWVARAGELAAWVKGHTMVRDDAYAEHYIDEEAKLQKRWVRKNLTLERLERHFRAATQQDVASGSIISLAALALTPDGESSYTRELTVDVDDHLGKNGAATQRAAFAWFDVLTKSKFKPILENSSNNSYHLRVVFNQDLEAGKARALGLWLIRDRKDYGLTHAPEVFPKTDELASPGNAGAHSTPIRLFGRYPKYEFWSKVFDGSEWLDDDESIDWILNTGGDDPALIPDDAIKHKKQLDEERKCHHEEIDRDEERPDVARVKEALSYYKNDDLHYDDWLNIGLSLNSWDDSTEAGLKLWVEWSKTSSKHRDGECEKRWNTFTPDCHNGRTIKSLFKAAVDNGWKPARRPGLPRIEVTTERHVVRDKAIKALAREERIFLRGNTLATVSRGSEETRKLFGGIILRNAGGVHSISVISEPCLGCFLTENASLITFHKNRKGEFEAIPCHPPAWLIQAVLSHGEYPGFRPILAVNECFYVNMNGEIQCPI